jgi:hypothetical protein
MSEVFRQLPEVIGSASAVLSTKRTMEVIPERLAVAVRATVGSEVGDLSERVGLSEVTLT